MVIIDNYDSFTYNLVDYFGKISTFAIEVFRHDAISISQLQALKPNYIVISPGPKTPNEAGISNDVIRHFSRDVPILGVCLGHQCMGHVFGARIIGAKQLMHGKRSAIKHNGHALFKGLANPFIATRYHSLVIDPNTVPDCIEVLARSEGDDEIMAIQHKDRPIYGLQFHPESICTPDGLTILKNFLAL